MQSLVPQNLKLLMELFLREILLVPGICNQFRKYNSNSKNIKPLSVKRDGNIERLV